MSYCQFNMHVLQAPGLIANGRDMGTKVFPRAMLKIYFTASIDVRAKRRYEQLIKSGSSPNLVNIHKSLKKEMKRILIGKFHH